MKNGSEKTLQTNSDWVLGAKVFFSPTNSFSFVSLPPAIFNYTEEGTKTEKIVSSLFLIWKVIIYLKYN